MKPKKKITWEYYGIIAVCACFLLTITAWARGGKMPDDLVLKCQSASQYTYSDMQYDLEQINSYYGDGLKISSLGRTADGRDIYHILAGSEKAENNILITGAIHGREYITAQLVMMNLNDLLNAAAQDISCKNQLEKTAVHFVPMINPDGYKDWALRQKSIPSITVEVGRGAVPVNPNQFDAIYRQNKQVIPAILSDLYQ